MALGLVCHFVEEVIHRNGSVSLRNLFDAKSLQLGRLIRGEYSEARIRETYLHNAMMHLEILPQIVKLGIRHFRMSSDTIPLGDHVPREYWDNSELRSVYKRIGDFARQNNMRVTLHPGQFCVLNSIRSNVVVNTIEELSRHAWLFDACEFDESPYYAINIHAGAGDRLADLIANVKSLPGNVSSRLTFENCESVANVSELYEVWKQTGVPVVFDSHHHVFNTGDLTMDDAYDLARSTWSSNITPLQHLANTEPGFENGSFTQRRRHSNYISYIPECQRVGLECGLVDIEVEAKTKNLALSNMVRDLGVKLDYRQHC